MRSDRHACSESVPRAVQIPEDIGYRMWQGGYMDPFTPRVLAQLDSIAPDSPAAQAGLEKGDKVVSINGTPISRLTGATLVA